MDVLAEFLDYFHIDGRQPPRRLFCAAARAFSRIPYENITKIIRCAETGGSIMARRGPEEVIADHIRWGSGGTCFSLTSAFLGLARRMGLEAEYMLADRGYGQDTHSALLVRIDGEPYLVDPGFLITEPVPLTLAGRVEIETGGERITLIPDGDRISLFTERGGKNVCRLTYKTAPVDAGEFGKAWDASFNLEMMRYPLLARAGSSGRIYLRGSMFQISNNNSVNRVKIPEDELVSKIAGEFGIHPALVARAMKIFGKQKDGAAL